VQVSGIIATDHPGESRAHDRRLTAAVVYPLMAYPLVWANAGRCGSSGAGLVEQARGDN
jgi:hypothetical protein